MNDLDRLRNEYKNRKQRFAEKDIYTWFNPANLFIVQQRQRNILSALQKSDISNLSETKILEVGCGAGGVLTEFLNFGAMPRNLYGVDLLEDRLAHARQRLAGSHFINADGQGLPFPSAAFDIVMQFTALSSILDGDIRQQVAKEMLRILKPNGLILWYDFWINPTNPQTHGITPREIHALFPGCQIQLHKITLAPPISRRLAPLSRSLASLLEHLKIFNSHYLGIITHANSAMH